MLTKSLLSIVSRIQPLSKSLQQQATNYQQDNHPTIKALSSLGINFLHHLLWKHNKWLKDRTKVNTPYFNLQKMIQLQYLECFFNFRLAKLLISHKSMILISHISLLQKPHQKSRDSCQQQNSFKNSQSTKFLETMSQRQMEKLICQSKQAQDNLIHNVEQSRLLASSYLQSPYTSMPNNNKRQIAQEALKMLVRILSKIIEENKQKIRNLELCRRIQAHLEEKRYLMSQVIQHVFETADRNEAIASDQAFFLLPFVIILKMLKLSNKFYETSQYISKNIHYILQKLQKPFVKYQLHPEINKTFFQIITRETTYKDLHEYLRKILIIQKELMIRAVPYYYNLFVLIVNQDIYFLGSKRQLLKYTVPFSFSIIERRKVKYEIIHEAIDLLEAQLNSHYHSKDI